MAKRAMKLIDRFTNLLECTTCGSRHIAMIKPQSGGQSYRGSWKCSFELCPTNVK